MCIVSLDWKLLVLMYSIRWIIGTRMDFLEGYTLLRFCILPDIGDANTLS